MALDVGPILDAIISLAAASGHFQRINQHEPKHAPGHGLTAAIWADYLGPAPGESGLAVTTALLRFKLRIYQNMLMEPQDAIDPTVLAAANALMTVYSAHLTLGGLVRLIDLEGAVGQSLSVQAGYLTIDNKMFRVMDLTIPMVVDDAWAQGA